MKNLKDFKEFELATNQKQNAQGGWGSFNFGSIFNSLGTNSQYGTDQSSTTSNSYGSGHGYGYSIGGNGQAGQDGASVTVVTTTNQYDC